MNNDDPDFPADIRLPRPPVTGQRPAWAELVCPICNGNNLHHGEVRVYGRPVEDGDGIKVSVKGATTEVIPQGAREFVGRRDHIEIHFTCETCGDCEEGDGFWLTIIQHKGTTFLFTRLKDEPVHVAGHKPGDES
jgi:hypothetical protein